MSYVEKMLEDKEFSPIQEFVPLYGLSTTPNQILVSTKSDVYNVEDLINKYKTKGYLFGAFGHPSIQLAMCVLDKSTNIKTTLVPYKQPVQLMMDVSTELTDYTIGGVGNSSSVSLIESGRLRSIGILSDLRSQGYKNLPEFSWSGFFVRSNTDKTIQTKLTNGIKKVMNSKEATAFTQKRLLVGPSELMSIINEEMSIIDRNLDKSTQMCKY